MRRNGTNQPYPNAMLLSASSFLALWFLVSAVEDEPILAVARRDFQLLEGNHDVFLGNAKEPADVNDRRLNLPDWRGAKYPMQAIYLTDTPPGPAAVGDAV
jgi:hypothetical protein